jgi:hypothetical protein
VISPILNPDAGLVWRRYRDHPGGFREAEADGSHYRHDMVYSAGESVRVPVFGKENSGKEMAIDEKQTGEEMHTIIGNRERWHYRQGACPVTASPGFPAGKVLNVAELKLLRVIYLPCLPERVMIYCLMPAMLQTGFISHPEFTGCLPGSSGPSSAGGITGEKNKTGCSQETGKRKKKKNVRLREQNM